MICNTVDEMIPIWDNSLTKVLRCFTPESSHFNHGQHCCQATRLKFHGVLCHARVLKRQVATMFSRIVSVIFARSDDLW